MQEIINLETAIKAYIFEAIEVKKAGLKVKMKETDEFEVSEEFEVTMERGADLKPLFKS